MTITNLLHMTVTVLTNLGHDVTDCSHSLSTPILVSSKMFSWKGWSLLGLLTMYSTYAGMEEGRNFSASHHVLVHRWISAEIACLPRQPAAGALWLLQGTSPEHNMNKFSLWWGLAEFNPFFSRVMNSLLYIWGMTPGVYVLPAHLAFLPQTILLAASRFTFLEPNRWEGCCLSKNFPWWLSGWDRGDVVKNVHWTRYSC